MIDIEKEEKEKEEKARKGTNRMTLKAKITKTVTKITTRGATILLEVKKFIGQ